MIVTDVRRPARSVEPITVTVDQVTDADPDTAVLALAIDAAGETPARLFGWEVTRWPSGDATVRLNRD